MPTATCNGISVYYETFGEGTPLVLISGLGGDSTFWQPSLEKLSASFMVIIYDTRGIGKTDAPEESYSIDMFADDLAALLDNLGIARAHILGFSMGGNIALQFALHYPARVLKLVIAASCATLNSRIRQYVDAVLAVYEGGASTRQMFDLVAPWLFSAAFLQKPENADFLKYDDDDPGQQPLFAWRNQYLAQRAFDATEQVTQIKAKTLILSAGNDVFANVDDAAVLAKNIPGAWLRVIPDAGHLFNYEEPELFHRHVLDFLGGDGKD